ncbi:hypothetical protein O6H91_20G038000 [Diphasiastrum complanatum]|uniref:Uncharacterized protein n=2 Tax=Diphasiastrum complanatum TaxID=34168 RepID=A0ACC2APJ4_DIPCM|nr:hypothetical protein O6H91_Y403900 [Diphasiastrum complanatum]KAJ7519431.1 hypothetical protein O6H91_20G038000 [Diphasiastrum complanatum]KAJ7519432.1 hypothetical protein O6H91_20G038000 [Diphasiastrum complanatum]
MGICMSTAIGSGKASNGTEKFSKKDKKREASAALAEEAKQDELIALVAGRNCSNGSSRIASLFTQQGRKGVNQDAMLVWEGFGMRKDTIFCGVFDGHGPYGHLVARRVRDSLPSKILAEWQNLTRKSEATGSDDEGTELGEGAVATTTAESRPDAGDQEPEMYASWKEAHLIAYKVMDKELKVHPSIDCFCSGTTAVTILKQGQDLVIANVGDSRAILGTKADDGSLVAVQLTVDLKPNLPQEEERIRQCKGRVFALQDEPEVHRVWLPHDNSPGLAMARAFGDFCLKEFGLIAVPEISCRQLSERDQFIVLATDGVWDVLSNSEVIDIIAAAPTRRTAARSLVESAVRAWRLKYPTSKVDDCAVVCLFLDANQISQERFEDKKTKPDSVTSTVTDQDSPTEPNCGIASVQESKTDFVRQKRLHKGIDAQSFLDPSQKTEKDLAHERAVHAQRSLKDCLVADEDEWSALEGVTRVNSLLNLPRFLGFDKETG